MSPPAATVGANSVIRATARYQEADEPPRQRPIIKIDPRHQQQELFMQSQRHLSEADKLAGSVRASIDSGRDNPFRPDGEIYKLTNPIVDYYKFGPNQSRSATPTYAELDYFSSKNKRKRRAAEKKAKAAQAGRDGRRPCWRRWFCCCGCCGGNKAETGAASQEQSNQIGATTLLDSQSAGATDTAPISEPPDRLPKGTDLIQGAEPPVVAPTFNKQLKQRPASKSRTQPTKKVQLDDETTGQSIVNGNNAASSARVKNNNAASDASAITSNVEESNRESCGSQPTMTNSSQEKEPKATKVKTVRTSRCVIS